MSGFFDGSCWRKQLCCFTFTIISTINNITIVIYDCVCSCVSKFYVLTVLPYILAYKPKTFHKIFILKAWRQLICGSSSVTIFLLWEQGVGLHTGK